MSVATPAARTRTKRGRETPTDMLRSLGLILLVVVPVWFLAQPGTGDAKQIRVVPIASDVAAFHAAAPGVPVPGALPAGWRATSSTPAPGALRIGWVTAQGQYAEYDATTAPAAPFLSDATGKGDEVGTLDVSGVVWRQFRDADDHTSLVREAGGGTVVVGGLRETATLSELRDLAAAVR